MLRKIIGIGMLTWACAAGAWADGGGGWSLLTFRANQLSVFQSGGSSYSGGLSWAPAIGLGESLGLRLSAGPIILKGLGGFLAGFDGELLVALASLDSWGLEAGPGIQKWAGGAGGGTAASANFLITRTLNSTFHAFLGYSPLFASGNFTHELKLGGGITF